MNYVEDIPLLLGGSPDLDELRRRVSTGITDKVFSYLDKYYLGVHDTADLQEVAAALVEGYRCQKRNMKTQS